MKIRFNIDENRIEFESGTEFLNDTLNIPMNIEWNEAANIRETKLDYSELVQLIKFLTKDL
jgi:hypothetical protein